MVNDFSLVNLIGEFESINLGGIGRLRIFKWPSTQLVSYMYKMLKKIKRDFI